MSEQFKQPHPMDGPPPAYPGEIPSNPTNPAYPNLNETGTAPPYPQSQQASYPPGPPGPQGAAPYPPSGPLPGPGVQPTVVIGHPVIRFGESPQTMTCPHCQAHITTEVSRQAGLVAWLSCLGLFAIGFLILITWFVCCVPFCIPTMMDSTHKCPNCQRVLGKRGGMGMNI